MGAKAGSTYGERLRARPRSYWIVGAVILLFTILAYPAIDERLKLDDLKNWLFLRLTSSPTNPAFPHVVKLVPIGDAEYWGPELAHRSPTNRAYLARLIRAADRADASVIALDFNLSLSGQERPARPGDYARIEPAYRAETDALVRAIGEVADRRPVVLAKVMSGPDDGPFTLSPDAWGLYGLCVAMRGAGRWDNPGTPDFPLSAAARRNIACGYINLMADKREVPPAAEIVGARERLDAFPLAVARARNPAAPARFEHGHFYASYIAEAALGSPEVALAPTALLRDPAAARGLLQGYPVIVSAAWHLDARGTGTLVDSHHTPIGDVSGGLIHANLVEAVLASRTYPAVPKWLVIAVEIGLGAAAMVLFALAPSTAVASLLLVAAMPLIFAIQWLSLQLLGLFFDLFAPVAGLGIHAILDRLFGPHEHAHAASG